jgi:hypothetical protein
LLRAIGGDEARRCDISTKRLAELNERASKLELRLAELRDKLAAVKHETVSTA